MKAGDSIIITLYGHSLDCVRDCTCGGIHKVRGTVVEVLEKDFVRAKISDVDHPLAMVDDKPRVITCSPEMYEA